MVSRNELRPAEAEPNDDPYAPRKLTLAENLIGAIKVIGGFALIGVLLWVLKLWKGA